MSELLKRITVNSAVMGGKPCIRGMRVTVGAMLDLLASGYSIERILEAYPYLEREDLLAALEYGAMLAKYQEFDLVGTV